jgi:pyridoxamine 5'-phosphate oxidase
MRRRPDDRTLGSGGADLARSSSKGRHRGRVSSFGIRARQDAKLSSLTVTDDQLARLRHEYEVRGLAEEDMADDPISEFRNWFESAAEAGIDEPNAFVLATVGTDGRPSARAVLMKSLDERGLVFFTNLTSRKSSDLAANPSAAATFVWTPLHRQVRFEGPVEQVDGAESDRYFATRPRGSQIAAHASPQSTVIGSRDDLDGAFARLEEEFEGSPVPRPTSWGGWLIAPTTVEFWQGQPNRFHDRVRYFREGPVWGRERLAP